MTTCPTTESIGAYVLGALDAGERQEIERHIRDCPICRDAALQFAHLPGVLDQLALEDVLAAIPAEGGPEPAGGWLPASMKSDEPAMATKRNDPDAVPIDSLAGHRRFAPKRVLLATAAAIILVVSGGLVGGLAFNDSSPQAPQARADVTWSATDGVGGIDARVELSKRDWGTDIQVRIEDTQPGQRCMLVVHTRGGQAETTGWWTTSNVREADVPASSSFALSDITRVDVVTAANTVLASLTESTR